MSITPVTAAALATRANKPFQQFGQANDAYTANGATGCTHTVLQYLAWLVKKRWYTHDEISRMVGYPNQSKIALSRRRGLYPSEVGSFLRKAGLPYAVQYNLSAYKVLQISNALGPVGFGHHYAWVPEWYEYTYRGVKADGKPNGFAHPLRRAGKTQLTGWAGAHFGACLGWDPHLAVDKPRVFIWEPNHGSSARPEKPSHDLIRSGQFRALYESYNKALGRAPYAVVPTKKIGG